jgi:RNA-directed DNA polymerase
MMAKLKALHQQLRQHRHEPIATTGQWLRSVVQGYFNSQAVLGNMCMLRTLRRRVTELWRQRLCRRSQKTHLNWQRFEPLISRWILTQCFLHPLPSVRFDVIYPR